MFKSHPTGFNSLVDDGNLKFFDWAWSWNRQSVPMAETCKELLGNHSSKEEGKVDMPLSRNKDHRVLFTLQLCSLEKILLQLSLEHESCVEKQKKEF